MTLRSLTCLALVLPVCAGSIGCGDDAGAILADAGSGRDAGSELDSSGPREPPPVCSITLDCGGATIPDEPKIPCSLRVDDGLGNVEYDGAAYVEKRGRSSQSFPKPQYAVELRTALDSEVDNPTNLLGMGKEDDWVLNGAYIDRSLLRNKLLYELFQSFGGPERYAPQIGHCELTLDGEYRGIYLLTERIERDDDRVDISADDTGDGSSFIVKQDPTDDPDGIREVGMANGSWSLVYPRSHRATPAQTQAIVAVLAQWQDLIIASSPDLFTLVDIDSAVDYVLIEEFAKNNDAYFLSMHVWRDGGGLIHFSLWDLDLSFGQPGYNDSESPQGWIWARPPMISRMASLPEFQQRLVQRWRELRTGVMSNESIFARIDFHVATIADHVAANFEKWTLEVEFLGELLYPVTSHADEIEQVRAWIATRLAWMDDNIEDYAYLDLLRTGTELE